MQIVLPFGFPLSEQCFLEIVPCKCLQSSLNICSSAHTTFLIEGSQFPIGGQVLAFCYYYLHCSEYSHTDLLGFVCTLLWNLSLFKLRSFSVSTVNNWRGLVWDVKSKLSGRRQHAHLSSLGCLCVAGALEPARMWLWKSSSPSLSPPR